MAIPLYILCAEMTASPIEMTEKLNVSGRKAQVESWTGALMGAFVGGFTGAFVGALVDALVGGFTGALVWA
jgi:outer membrane lipoprotein SlyB